MSKNNSLNNKVILITGGTGSFGNQFVKEILTNATQKQVIIFLEMNLNNIIWKKIF